MLYEGLMFKALRAADGFDYIYTITKISEHDVQISWKRNKWDDPQEISYHINTVKELFQHGLWVQSLRDERLNKLKQLNK